MRKKNVSFMLGESLIADVKELADRQGINPSDFYRNAVKTYVDQQKTISIYKELLKALTNLAVITDLTDPEQLKILQEFQTLSRVLGDSVVDVSD